MKGDDLRPSPKILVVCCLMLIDLFRFQIGYGVWKFDCSRIPKPGTQRNAKWKKQQHKKTTNLTSCH